MYQTKNHLSQGIPKKTAWNTKQGVVKSVVIMVCSNDQLLPEIADEKRWRSVSASNLKSEQNGMENVPAKKNGLFR